jgi:hypothetical protein
MTTRRGIDQHADLRAGVVVDGEGRQGDVAEALVRRAFLPREQEVGVTRPSTRLSRSASRARISAHDGILVRFCSSVATERFSAFM